MSFYSFLSAYPQMIEKIQGGKLTEKEEFALVRDFTRNNRSFARHCILIRHPVIQSFRLKYIRSFGRSLLMLSGSAAISALAIAWPDTKNLQAVHYILMILSAAACLGFSIAAARVSSRILISNMHNLIKNHYRPVDKHRAYQDSRVLGLDQYSTPAKVIYCEGWPERAIVIQSGTGFEIIYEELCYSDEDEVQYIEDGSLKYQWVEDRSSRLRADSLEQAVRLVAEAFSHGADRDEDIFSWLD